MRHLPYLWLQRLWPCFKSLAPHMIPWSMSEVTPKHRAINRHWSQPSVGRKEEGNQLIRRKTEHFNICGENISIFFPMSNSKKAVCKKETCQGFHLETNKDQQMSLSIRIHLFLKSKNSQHQQLNKNTAHFSGYTPCHLSCWVYRLCSYVFQLCPLMESSMELESVIMNDKRETAVTFKT